MATTKPCPACGAPLDPGLPEGQCPACMLEAGLAGEQTLRDEAQASVPSPEELNRLFSEVEILELIGAGGMGVVYRARQPRLDREVAVKILSPDLAERPDFAQRFEREARALASLAHPNIVAVHDFGTAGDMYYLVMELIDGTNLRQVLRSGKLAPEEALGIVPRLCDALQYAHDRGVVHRDIKPENVLLTADGEVKIVDFGLAKTVQGGRQTTVTGHALGTPAYMAPEQIEKPDTVDHRADIYSMGVVFYEMLTGELPLGRFAPPSGKVAIDVRIDDVVLRTLEKERELRYQQAAEVKTDIHTLTGSEPGAWDAAGAAGAAASAAASAAGMNPGTSHTAGCLARGPQIIAAAGCVTLPLGFGFVWLLSRLDFARIGMAELIIMTVWFLALVGALAVGVTGVAMMVRHGSKLAVETGEPARRSRLAVAGFAMAVIASLTMVGSAIFSPQPGALELGQPAQTEGAVTTVVTLGMLARVLQVIAVGLSIAGLVRIAISQPRLAGAWLAAVGIVLGLLGPDILGLFAYLLLGIGP